MRKRRPISNYQNHEKNLNEVPFEKKHWLKCEGAEAFANYFNDEYLTRHIPGGMKRSARSQQVTTAVSRQVTNIFSFIPHNNSS
jgi:hypothetical protein